MPPESTDIPPAAAAPSPAPSGTGGSPVRESTLFAPRASSPAMPFSAPPFPNANQPSANSASTARSMGEPPMPREAATPLSNAPLVLRAIALSKSFKSPSTTDVPDAPANQRGMGGSPMLPQSAPPPSPPPPTSPAPSPDRLQVLRDVSLEIHEGELVSICGASGSGKSTLLQILGGLDRPDSGELHWNGERVTARGNAFLARRRALWLGYVFQSYHLIPELDALENVVLAGRIAGRSVREVTPRALDLLASVGLSLRLRHHPAKLSGGECQRVAIARALINNPRLILADEPTGNLDEATGEKIMELLLHLAAVQRVALVLVTHNPAFALRAPRRLLLTRGTLTEHPSP